MAIGLGAPLQFMPDQRTNASDERGDGHGDKLSPTHHLPERGPSTRYPSEGSVAHMGPNLSQEQLERVYGHLLGMAEALDAAHATHDLSERQVHWDEYFNHEAQVHRLIPPKTDTPAPLL